MINEYCYFCGSKIELKSLYKNKADIYDSLIVNCSLCGQYTINNKIRDTFKAIRNETAYYLYRHKKQNKDFLYILENEKSKKKNEISYYSQRITVEDIKAFFPQNFSEKINNCILALVAKAQIPGNSIELSCEELATMCCIRRIYKENFSFNCDKSRNQIEAILSYLKECDLINNYTITPTYNPTIELKTKLWQEAEKLQKSCNNKNDVFLAIRFDKSNNDLNLIRSAINEALLFKGLNLIIMDRIIHNKQIVPYMFKQIRDSRFLIMDTTYSNLGAYYEAGYAEGLGKEVIICCRKDEFDKQFSTMNKLKIKNKKVIKNYETNNDNCQIHFDIAQKQLLIWNDYKDLTNKLKQWIEILFE